MSCGLWPALVLWFLVGIVERTMGPKVVPQQRTTGARAGRCADVLPDAS
jgi:hypothetical protein